MQISQAKAAKYRGFHGLCGLLLLLLSAAVSWSQTIEFLPGAPSIYEAGAAAGTNVSVIVTRTPATGAATIEFATFEGTANSGSDYIATNGMLNFADGETFKVITVPILDDAVPESTETFGMLLFNAVGATLGSNSVTLVTIFDNDTTFRFTPATNVIVTEDITNAVLLVQRLGDTAGSASVEFSTFDGTATSGANNDFISISGTILFTNGQEFASISIPINDDCLVETNAEIFTVVLSNPVGGAVSPTAGTAIVRITDNDTSAGRLRITSARIIDPVPSLDFFSDPLAPFVREGNTTRLAIRVDRECGFQGTITVQITNTIGSFLGGLGIQCPGGDDARHGLDFVLDVPNGELTFPSTPTDPRDTWREFEVTIIDDGLVELDELVTFSLFDPELDNINNNSLLGNVRSIPLWIRSDDFSAGSVDPFYNNIVTPGANNEVYAISVINTSVQGHNGKTLLAGDFTGVNASVRNRIARVYINGVVDQSFNPGTGADGFIAAIAQQQDGKIVIGGGFTSYNNVSRGRVARLNEDGSLDDTFLPGSGVNGVVYDLAVQPSGKIILVGDFDSYRDTPVYNIVRLNADGTLDASFDPGLGTDAPIWTMALEPNGSILIGGDFQHVDNQERSRIARLQPDGALDTTFAPAFGADRTVFALAVQPDSRILVGGAFELFDGESHGGLVRLTPSGVLDATYHAGTATDGAVFEIELQADGRVLIGGDFTTYNGTPRSNIARLYEDGTLDTSFGDVHYLQVQPGANGFVNSISLQADGNLMVGGAFSIIGGGPDQRLGMETNAIRPQFNFTRMIGGTNPSAFNMPGNIEFVSATYSVDENSLSGSVIVTVRRLNGRVGPVTVTFYTEDGTARAGVDYAATTSTITWADCELTTRSFTIPVLDNTFVEGNRQFFIVLTNPVNGGILAPTYPALGAQTRATVTVVDNDFNRGVLGFSQPIYNIDESSNTVTITVTRTNGSVGQVTVQYATYDLTATNGSIGDFTGSSGTLTFLSGQTNKTFTVPIFPDTAQEPEEWFGIRLTNATGGATIGLSNATVLVYDNDNGRGSVSFVNTDFSVSETSAVATITLRRTSGGVGFLTNDFIAYELPLAIGVARAGIDFTPITNQVVFPPGVRTQFVTVPLIGDRFVEGNERIGLLLTNVSNGTLGFIRQATLTVVDDDFYGNIGFGDVNYFISERGTNAVITVLRTGGDAEEVSVDYTITEGLASNGLDYIGSSNTLVFPDGVLSATITVPIIDDELLEGNESMTLALGNYQKASPTSISNAQLTIIDDEALHAPAGSVDTTFSANPNSFVNAIGLQSNGKLIVGGDFTSINSFGMNRLARLTLTGTTDPLFKIGSGANDQVLAILVQSDDKVIIGGRFTTYDVTNRSRIARLNADGTIDSSFNPGAGADNPVFALAQTADQRIVLGGSFTTVNGITRPNVAVLNTNGSVDMTFNTGAGLNGTVYAVAVQPDGKILIGGDFTIVNNTNRTRIARLHPNGSLDLSFNPGIGAVGGAVRALLIQPDGNIVVGGSFTNFNGMVQNHLTRLLPSGAIDPSFNAGTGADAAVLALALQPNNRILVAGDFRVFAGVTRNRLTRLNPDGSIDPTINFGTGADSFIAAVLSQANEQIVIAGGFTEFNGTPRRYVARLIGGVNGGAGAFNFISSTFTANEDGTNAVITVLRDGGTEGMATVNFSTFDGSAFAGVHYAGTNGTLTFPAGETLQSFTVPIINNVTVDGEVVLFLSLDSPSPGSELGLVSDSALVIRDDDSIIRFFTENYSVNEGTVAGHAAITVERFGSTNSAVAVSFSTADITATSPEDYSAANGVLVFAPGETLKQFTVPVNEDAVVETSETVELTLASPLVLGNVQSQVYLGLSNATLTINENDFLPGQFVFTVQTNVFGEGDNYAIIVVLRTNGSAGVASVRYTVSDETAQAGTDFIAASGTLSFADGETVKSFAVLIQNDQLVEGDETALMTLSNPTGGATLGALNLGRLMIVDDESGVQFESATYGGAEDDGFVRITVVRSGNTNVTASVAYFTLPETATSPADYTNTSGVLTFDPGVTRRSFDVGIASDTIAEGPETFRALLNNPSPNVQIGSPSNTVVTVQDSARFVHFSDTAYIVDEGETNAVITITRYGLLTRGISVMFRTVSAAAVEGLDYLYTSNIVKFAEGESNKTVLVPIIDDGLTEGDEVLAMELFFPTNAAVGTNAIATLTITDNDTGPGEADNTFDPGVGANKFVRSVAVQPDGKILVGGAFTNYANITNRNYLARLHTNGVFDTNFNVTNINAVVSAIQVSADGRIVIGGAFTNIYNTAFNRLARLMNDGSIDPTLSQPIQFNGAVNTLDLQADGRIVAGGGFSLPVRGVTRLRVNGSTDLTFDLGSGTDAPVLAAKLQSDGMILVGGAFTNISGFIYPRLARIAVNGLIDTSFQPLTITNGNVLSIAVQADGKIVIGGNFRFVNGVSRSGIARLNADGSLDSSFNPGTGANGTIHTVNVLGNGQVFVGGDFTSFNNIIRGRYALLLPDGSVDLEFDSEAGADNTVYTSVVQPDQKIVIGGDFTSVSGLARRGVARLNVGEVLSRITGPELSGGTAILTVNTTPGLSYVLEGSTNMVQWLSLSTNTASGTTLIISDPNASGFPHRFYRVRRLAP